METPFLLRGHCSCKRNQYSVTTTNPTEDIRLILNSSSHLRRLQASPITAFIKVPLSSFRSCTISYRDDETHQSIRRTFSTPDRDHFRHQFCGICGTPLLMLDDSSPEEDQFVSVTLGSLIDEDLDRLTTLGLFDNAEEDEGLPGSSSKNITTIRKSDNEVRYRGAPWFEDLIEDSALGRIRRQRGGHISADGTTESIWEVVEWSSADADESFKRKRTIEPLEGSPDAVMKD